jgi:ABC-type transport system involved in cytochrome c biogenesis permease component
MKLQKIYAELLFVRQPVFSALPLLAASLLLPLPFILPLDLLQTIGNRSLWLILFTLQLMNSQIVIRHLSTTGLFAPLWIDSPTPLPHVLALMFNMFNRILLPQWAFMALLLVWFGYDTEAIMFHLLLLLCGGTMLLLMSFSIQLLAVALHLPTGQQGLLLLPFVVPILIFGANADVSNALTHIELMMGVLLLLLPLFLWLACFALDLAREELS